MTMTALLFALLALLLTPGPTNTLLAVAGTERGWRGALWLIPYELAAYLAVTLPLVLGGAVILPLLPMLKPLITAAAALWVLVLAVRLWRLPKPGAAVQTSGQQVFVTTLLNPKALIIGLVLLPGAPLLPRVLLFALLVIGVAALWAAIGACLSGGPDCPANRAAPLIRRSAAVWLGALSVGLLISALPA